MISSPALELREENLMPKIAVYSPNGSISTRDSSHRAAWPKMVLDSRGETDYVLQPEDSLANYEQTWLYLGMEWVGALNLFGGASDENSDKLVKIMEANHLWYLPTTPYLENCPKLGTIAKQRKVKPDTRWAKVDWDILDLVCGKAGIIEQGRKENCVVGDSHALSLYDGKSRIFRYDHKTLHGALKEGLTHLFPNYDLEWKRVTLNFGNIDIQHHLASRTVEDIDILAKEYIVQASKIIANTVEIVLPLPIFEETRKIATPGYYKGKPWNGTWEQRNKIKERFIESLFEFSEECTHIKLLGWPEYIFNKDESFNVAYAEKPRGVHLSWEHRRQTWPN